jgi:hypothetical protein
MKVKSSLQSTHQAVVQSHATQEGRIQNRMPLAQGSQEWKPSVGK